MPDTDEEYDKEKTEIEANMLLYSKSREMLEMLKYISKGFDDSKKHLILKKVKQLIKEATELWPKTTGQNK